MNLQDVALFLSAAELLNLRQAARIHYITFSTMARHITSLEESLGLKLFVRSNNGLKLTEAGEHFYPIARDMLQLKYIYQYNMQKLGYDNPASGSASNSEFVIVHGAFNRTYYTLYQLIDKYLAFWIKKSCRLHCVREDMMLDMVRSEFAQVGVALEKQILDDPDFESAFFFRTNCMLFVPNGHPLAARDNIGFSELKQMYGKYSDFLPDRLDVKSPLFPQHDDSNELLISAVNSNLRQKKIETAQDIEVLCNLWHQKLVPLMDYSERGILEKGYSGIVVLPEGTHLPMLRDMHCLQISDADIYVNWRIFWKKEHDNPDIDVFKEAYDYFGTNFSFTIRPGQKKDEQRTS